MTNIEKWEEEFDSKFFKITVGYGERGIFHGEPEQLKDFIKTLLQSEQTRIAEEVEKKAVKNTDKVICADITFSDDLAREKDSNGVIVRIDELKGFFQEKFEVGTVGDFTIKLFETTEQDFFISLNKSYFEGNFF